MPDFNTFFQQLTANDSLVFLLLLIGAFLIGMLFGAAIRGRKVRKLKKELKKKDQLLSELEVKLKTQEEDLALKEADLKKAAYDLNQVRLTADKYEQENTELNKKVYELKSSFDKTVQTDATYDASLEQLNDQIIRLKADNEALKLELADEASEDSKHAIQLQALQQQIAYLKARNEELQNDSGGRISEDTQTQEKIDALEQQNSYLKQQNAELMERLAKVSEQPVADPIPLGTSDDRFAAFEARLAQLEQENQHLQSQVNGMQVPTTTDRSTTPITTEEPEPEITTQEPFDLFRTDRALLADNNKDDLSRIDGIGPFIEKKLNDIGVTSFAQIAKWSDDDIASITQQIQYFEGRIVKDNWVGQAQILMNEPPQVEPVIEDKAAAVKEDNLKVIEGIGPKIEAILKKAGIQSLDELAKADPADIQFILEQEGPKYKMHDPATWPAQARLAANGDWDVLNDYQDKLKGGRDVDE